MKTRRKLQILVKILEKKINSHYHTTITTNSKNNKNNEMMIMLYHTSIISVLLLLQSNLPLGCIAEPSKPPI